MKFLVILGVFISAVFAYYHTPRREEMVAARNDCFEELGVSEEYREKIKKFEYPDVEIVHKYVRCTSLKLGYWDDITGFNVDKLAESFSEHYTDALTEVLKCVDKNDQQSTVTAWAYRNYVCLAKSPVMSSIRNRRPPAPTSA